MECVSLTGQPASLQPWRNSDSWTKAQIMVGIKAQIHEMVGIKAHQSPDNIMYHSLDNIMYLKALMIYVSIASPNHITYV